MSTAAESKTLTLPVPGVERGAVPIDLDRRRVLFFDNRALSLLLDEFGDNYVASLFKARGDGIQLRSVDALEFFVWAGLQREADVCGEPVTREFLAEQVTPLNVPSLGNAVFTALRRAMYAPAPPGKTTAAAASPAPAAKRKHRAKPNPGHTLASTSLKRSASPSASSR